MNKILKIAIFVMLILATFSLIYLKYNKSYFPEFSATNKTLEVSPLKENETKKINLDPLGISFNIPNYLTFEGVPNFNVETKKLDSYNFYIQRESYDKNNAQSYFQMYGLIQFDIPSSTLEDLYKMKEDTNTYEYTKDIDIKGVKGLEAQFKGQRNRYVYYLLLNNRILTISVSEPTDENKKLAETILNTLEVSNTTTH